MPESGEAEAAMARKQPSSAVLREFLSKVGPDQTSLHYRKKQLIYAQGDPADGIFYVQKGRVKLTVVSPRGKSAVVAIVGPGEFFAEGCLAGQPLRTASAAAMTEATLMRIERRAMVAALHGPSALTDLVQLEREAARPRAAHAGPLWQRRKTRARPSQDQPGNAGRNDRHHTLPGQWFHEQVSQAWLHRVQRRVARRHPR